MNRHEQERIAEVLRQALPPVDVNAAPDRDLWPEMLRRLDEPAPLAFGLLNRPWFDWALLAALAGFAAAFPSSIPTFLYYL